MKKIYISKTRTLDVNIAKELIKDLKIIDAKVDGNTIIFFLGAKEIMDYHGDDWDKYPYKNIAGSVHEKYVTYTLNAYYSYATNRCAERGDNSNDDEYSKNDFKEHLSPICCVSKGIPNELKYISHDYDEVSHVSISKMFYYDDCALEIFENINKIAPFAVELFSSDNA